MGELPEAIKEWKERADGMLQDIIDGAITLTHPFVTSGGMRAASSNIREAREVSVILRNTDWSYLNYEYVLPTSMVVCSDIEMKNVYDRDVDYKLNEREGYLRRTQGSTIPDGGTVYCWFLYLKTTAFQKGTRITSPFGYDENYV